MFQRKVQLMLIFLAIFILPVTAQEYYISAQLEIVQTSGGNNSWSSPVQFYLNLTESKSLYGVTVNYNDIGNSNTLALFRITGGSVSDASLGNNQQVCIKGTCASSNSNPNNVGDIRLTLINILPATTTIASTTTSFNGTYSPVYTYLYVNSKQLVLTRNPTTPDTFDAGTYFSQETGWSADKKTTVLDLYFERLTGVGVDISETGKRGDTILRDLRYETINDNKIHYMIEEEGTYTFTVTYDKAGIWGRKAEHKDYYVVAVKGITIATNTIAAIGSFDVYLPASKTITMTEKGVFDQANGAKITDIGKNGQGEDYRFEFSNAANYRINFKGDSGTKTVVEFNVLNPPQPLAAVTPIVGALNREQTGNQVAGGEGGWDTGTYLLLVLIVGAIIMFVYLLTRKKGKAKMARALQ